ncbi:MAG: TonB family protein [Candidatus Cloacimonetes bacterium]|nr:TonB family protein [Candidatus Cloacimonadota bacterium]
MNKIKVLALFITCLLLSVMAYAEIKQPNYEKLSVTQLTELALDEDPIAQFNLGDIYYQGRGVPQDFKKAAKWFRQAANILLRNKDASARIVLWESENSKRPGPKADAAQDDDGSKEFISYYEPPMLLDKISPIYPKKAKKNLIQGTVVLEVQVLKDGSVGNINVKRSVPGGLDQAAIEAVKKVRFCPGKRNGKPVIELMMIPIEFRLK